ncbi:MAG: hypothetical protein KH828_05680 [Clostridiales bacterium]|nr:hypothetical protein [Clostridiales bacterium]
MSPERLAEVRNCLENPSAKLPDSSSSTFIGLQNIYKRLKLFYSQKAQLIIESKEHCGTSIVIRIPTNSLKE